MLRNFLNRPRFWIISFITIAMAVGLWIFRDSPNAPLGKLDFNWFNGANPNATSMEQTLFFANANFDALIQEKRTVNFGSLATIQRAMTLWEELKSSTLQDHLPLIPNSLTPVSILFGAQETLIIELPEASLAQLHLGPSWEQYLMQTVTLTMSHNLPGVSRVKLTASSQDLLTLAGHSYSMHPIYPTSGPTSGPTSEPGHSPSPP